MNLLNYKITPIWKISVKDGKTSMSDSEWDRYRKWLLSHEGEYEFIIKKKFKKRSLPQNAWCHGVIVPMIGNEIGEEDHNKVFALLKSKFLSKTEHIAGKDGKWEEVNIVGRTSKLSTEQFGIFCEKCRKWASEFLGIVIPDPDPSYRDYPVLIEHD